jgi:hypothetical protein
MLKPVFFKRYTIWFPAPLTWAIIAVSLLAAIGVYVTHIQSFLCATEPTRGEILVVEGWVPDYVLVRAKQEFQTHPYRLLITTGGPLESGAFLSEYRTLAFRAAASFIKMGIADSLILPTPAAFHIKDRTYASAIALRDTLLSRHIAWKSMDIVSLGTHSRRSRMLFARALGKEYKTGVISIPDKAYDSRHWWRYSDGIRNSIDETLGLLYILFFFQGQ